MTGRVAMLFDPAPSAAAIAPRLGDDEPCPCRRVAEGRYSVVAGCPRHDEGKGIVSFWCVCKDHRHCRCLACEESRRRGGGR